MWTPAALVEVFHLTFLRAFASSVPAEHFAIKGGCNLRFFFGSARYSEDLDLDVCEVPVHQIREKVMAILESGVTSFVLYVPSSSDGGLRRCLGAAGFWSGMAFEGHFLFPDCENE